VSTRTEQVERLEGAIEMALKIGLALSTVLLLAGLVAGAPGPLRWGIVLLMFTPVVRVAVVTMALALERDWLFTLISLFVLAVLVSGMWVAVRR
jgi:uncharacterized membrane protein